MWWESIHDGGGEGMTYLEKLTEYMIENGCPFEKFDSGIDMDENTYTSPFFCTGERGCRGITCKECWNKEAAE